MTPSNRWHRLVGLALLATTLGACGTGYRAAVYIPDRPPRAVVEVRGAYPGSGHAWVRGYYQWTGRSYVWVPGHWERWPRARARWYDGSWRHDRRHGWYWVEGHWR